MSKKSEKEAQRQEAIEYLREIFSPGDIAYTILRHRSQSGMQREISVIARTDTGIRCIDYLVARALDYRIGKHDGVVMGGCGMDMGFALVYNLSRTLFPDGFAVNGVGRNGDTSGWDKDGGYALRHQWI